MTNYNESAVSGTKWTRCNKITIANPFKVPGYALFSEENILAYEGPEGVPEYMKVPVNDTCVLNFSEGGLITRYDPNTGEPIPASITHEEVYAILYSLYRHAAALRDLGAPQPPLAI